MYRKEPVLIAPWKGWDSSAPPICLPPNSFSQIDNTLINKGRLQTFPWLNPFTSTPTALIGVKTFLDAAGSWHTVGFDQNNEVLYYGPPWTPVPRYIITSGNSDPRLNGILEPMAGINPGLPSSSPMAMEMFANRLYFCNGINQLSYVNGDNGWYPATDTIAALPGSSLFLGKLAQKLIMANCTEPAPEFAVGGSFGQPTNYPVRVRWSQTLNPQNWTDFTAGFNDLFEVEDVITGFTTLGPTGYVFRTNGIIAMSPTGIAGAPFRFENFSIGPKGIGCNTMYSLATYGPFCCFVALDDIYYFDGGAPVPIGGQVKKQVFTDLYNASSTAIATMLGTLYSGVDYLAYWLSIPQQGDILSINWIYNFNQQTWIREESDSVIRAFDNIAIA